MPIYEEHVHDVHDELYGVTKRRIKAMQDYVDANPSVLPEGVTVTPAPQEADPPPLGGAGSGRDEWAAYAQGLGIEVTDDDTRDDIVALVEDHTKE